MNKTDIAKNIVNLVVGLGTVKIVTGIIQHNTEKKTVTDKVAINSAGVVAGLMASDATQSYTDNKIDEFIAWWNENVEITKAP